MAKYVKPELEMVEVETTDVMSASTTPPRLPEVDL